MCLWILLSLHKKLNVEFLSDPYQDLFFSYHTLMTFQTEVQSNSSIFMPMIQAYYRDSDLNSLANVVNQKMQKNTEWFASNKLNVSVSKSTAMLFHPSKKIIDTDGNMIKINNTTVPVSISTKFLGMYIDNNLACNAHTKHINKKNSKEWVFFPASEMNDVI